MVARQPTSKGTDCARSRGEEPAISGPHTNCFRMYCKCIARAGKSAFPADASFPEHTGVARHILLAAFELNLERLCSRLNIFFIGYVCSRSKSYAQFRICVFKIEELLFRIYELKIEC